MIKKTRLIFKKKHYLTLLELLVAMSILSGLLTLVFGFFRELSTIDGWTKEQQTRSFQKRYVESRLFYLFSRVVNDADSERTHFFFCEGPIEELSIHPSLVFSYANGVRLNPIFSGDVLGRLYVNKKDQLCLATWPMPTKQDSQAKYEPSYEMHKEILLDGVKSIKYEFFAAPARPNGQSTAPEMVRGGWDDKWLASYKQTPSLMKIHLKLEYPSNLTKKNDQKRKEEELEFMFYLPVSEGFHNYIYYKNTL